MKQKILSGLTLIFSLLFIPISAYLLSIYLMNSFNEMSKKIEPSFDVSLVCEIVNSDKNSDLYRQMGDSCTEIGWIELMGTVGLWMTVFTLGLISLIWISSKLVGSNRNRLAFIFPKLVTFSLITLSFSIVVQGILGVFGFYELQTQLAGRWYPVITACIGIGAAIVAIAIISAAMKIRLKPTMMQMAVEVSQSEQLKLRHFVETVAKQAGARAPKNILLGLEPTFYATAADVTALSSNTIVSGETLYLSLPLMRLFDNEELRAVIGHELGHFKGEDVIYTMKFAPVYRALGSAINDVKASDQIFSLPALALLGFLHKNFEGCEKQVSRDREFRADEVGAKVGGAKNLVSALLKLSVFGGFWSDLRSKVIDHIDLGRPVTNISSLYASAVSFDTDSEKAHEFARECADKRIHHPTDSHPTLGQRMANLHVGPDIYDQINIGLPSESSAGLIEGLNELEERLSVDEQKLLIAVGLAAYECRKPDGENPFTIARVVQAAAAHLVCADGVVLQSEISMAEQLGEQLVPNFSQLEFRESCSKPDTLPSKEDLLEAIKAIFDQDSRLILINFLSAIADTDGEVSQEEAEFIESIRLIN